MCGATHYDQNPLQNTARELQRITYDRSQLRGLPCFYGQAHVQTRRNPGQPRGLTLGRTRLQTGGSTRAESFFSRNS